MPADVKNYKVQIDLNMSVFQVFNQFKEGFQVIQVGYFKLVYQLAFPA